MSLSVGFGLLSNRAEAVISCPAWQYPHCGTSTCSHAFCNGCDPSGDNPSMVFTSALTVEIGVWHARTGLPPRSTVHAPHAPMPHPNLVPFNLRLSRSTHNKGISPGTSTV